MDLSHLSEDLFEELNHYHLFVWKDGDAAEFAQEQEQLKNKLQEQEKEE